MNETEEVKLTDPQRYWLEQIRACEASGKTIAEYAADHGVKVHAMYAGKKKLVEKGILSCRRRERFQRAQVVDTVGGSEWRVQLPNGVSVAFAGSVDARTLTTVLSAAASVE
ncbi:hypothetical protein DJ031_15390 [bacterium endosymbiont of Escarpia laminata]|nr:MAG: hypothetical protein DJ031_15390 [bacterium endosymbiont of Escarpia laminata]